MTARPRLSQRQMEQGKAILVVLCAFLTVFLAMRLKQVLTPRASDEACRELLDRYFSHQAFIHHRDARPSMIMVAKRKARTTPAYHDDVRRCRRQLSDSQVRCGIAAPTMNALEQCLQ